MKRRIVIRANDALGQMKLVRSSDLDVELPDRIILTDNGALDLKKKGLNGYYTWVGYRHKGSKSDPKMDRVVKNAVYDEVIPALVDMCQAKGLEIYEDDVEVDDYLDSSDMFRVWVATDDAKANVESATTVRTYQNKRNPNKYIERHDDGYGHRSMKQYMQWDRDGGTVTNPTGDGKLHRWRKRNADELLEDYYEIHDDECPVDEFGNPVEQCPNPEIYGASDIDWSNPPATYIQEGLYWDEDGHEFEVIERTGNKCKVTETWIAEDSGRDMKRTYTYNIKSDPVNKTTQEYMYDPKYPEYSRKYAGNAFNYPYGNDPYNPDDTYEYDIEDDPYSEDWDEVEDYRSSTRGDYGPSNPWDAPGMSVSDFI